MVGSYDMIALDLDSQIQLLSRIQFLTRFSANLVQITGEHGSGKTWISERYLEAWANDPIQSLLICNSNQHDPQHRAIILRQIVRDGVFNEENTILQSLEHMLDEQGVHALIVIDDAHLLSADIVAELWALICEAQRRDNWQINVLLFSLRGKLNKWLHKVSSGQGEKPLELEINPLTESERDMFIDVLMASREMDAASRRVLKKKALSLPLLPGELKKLGSQEMASMDEKKPRLRWVMVILALSLVVVGGALVWLAFMPNAVKNENIVALPNSLEARSKGDTQVPELPTAIDPLTAQQIKDGVHNDTTALSPALTVEGMTVGRSDAKRHEVVLSDSLVEAMIDDQDIDNDDIVPSEAALIPEPAKTPVVSVQSQSPNEIKKSISSRLNLPLANKMLLSIPASNYALQLAALESEQAVNEFIQEHSLQNRVFVYETRRKGAPWFMVLFDKYPSALDARDAQKLLPENLRNLSPWPKSFVRIHEEIRLVN